MCVMLIRVVGISVTPGVCWFFVLGTFKILCISCFKMFKYLSLTMVILLCHRTVEVMSAVQLHPCARYTVNCALSLLT